MRLVEVEEFGGSNPLVGTTGTWGDSALPVSDTGIGPVQVRGP